MKRLKATAQPRSGKPPRYTKPRVAIASRLQVPLHEQLKLEAELAGRSISEEIEHRLARLFSDERSMLDALDYMYGPENAALLTVLGELIKTIDFWAPMLAATKKQPGNATWLTDPFLFEETLRALNSFLEMLRPDGHPVLPAEHQSLRGFGRQSTNAMLALLGGSAAVDASLAKSDWAARARKKLSKVTLAKIAAAAKPDES
jgi:hypothetical protein